MSPYLVLAHWADIVDGSLTLLLSESVSECQGSACQFDFVQETCLPFHPLLAGVNCCDQTPRLKATCWERGLFHLTASSPFSMEARAGTEGRGRGGVLLAGTLLIACSACTFVHKVTAEGCTYYSELGTVSCIVNHGEAAQLFSWAFSQLTFPHTLAIQHIGSWFKKITTLKQAYQIQAPSCSFLPQENIWFCVTFYIFTA